MKIQNGLGGNMRRREFLKTSVAGAAAFTFSGLTGVSGRAYAANVQINLVAESAAKALAAPATTTIWQYRDTTVAGAKGPGALASGLRVTQGDLVTVNLTNSLTLPVGFVIPGLSVSPTTSTAPGATQAYTFTATEAGSFLFTDNATNLLGRAMGLAGPLIVMPADGSPTLVAGGIPFDNQYTLFLSELDTRLNAAVVAGGDGVAELANYEPDYYFVNGLRYPATETDVDTAVKLVVATPVRQTAMRFINGGLHLNSMHFHGYHANVAFRNRIAQTAIVEKDTVAVGIAECVDVLVPVTQPGKYEVHNHYLPAVTGAGFYPNGALIMLEAVAA